jgi:formate hydrogenlyase subunit 4
MTFAIDLLQLLVIVGAAPLLSGVVGRIKARIQNRRGASIFRPYAELRKLFGKEDLVPPTASPLFRLCPVVLFAATLAAAAFIPALHASALLGNTGDFILLVYLLALARFFLILGAMTIHTAATAPWRSIFLTTAPATCWPVRASASTRPPLRRA